MLASTIGWSRVTSARSRPIGDESFGTRDRRRFGRGRCRITILHDNTRTTRPIEADGNTVGEQVAVQGQNIWGGLAPPLPSFFPSLLFPFYFPPLPHSLTLPSLRSRPLKQSYGSGAEPQRKSNFGRFSRKIWHLVASNLLFFSENQLTTVRQEYG